MRLLLSNGIGLLSGSLSDWGTLLNGLQVDVAQPGQPATTGPLPVLTQDLATLLKLRTVGDDPGLLDQIGEDYLPAIDARIDQLEELQALLEVLPGFAVECLVGQPDCGPDDFIQVRFTHTVENLEAISDFDDETKQYLLDLAAAADIDGSLNYLADLTFDFVFGVDPTGFFLRGDSSIRLHVFARGELSTSYDLPVPGLGVSTTAGSAAMADFVIALTGDGVNQRIRTEQLNDPASLFAVQIEGTARVGLQLAFGVGADTDLDFAASWTIPVNDNSLGQISSQYDYPSFDDFYDAAMPLLESGFDTLFGGELLDLLSGFPLPLAASRTESDEGAIEAKEGIDLLNVLRQKLGLTIHEHLTADQIIALIQGSPLPEGTNLLKAQLNLEPGDIPPLELSYDFDFGFGAPGSLASITVEDGGVGARIVPTADIHFGIDTGGFYIEPQTTIGGQLTGNATALGRWNDFGVRLDGTTQLQPSIRFDETSDPRIRIPQLIPHIVGQTDVTIGTVTGTVTADLLLDLLDYVDVDGNTRNNTQHGGDPFTVRGTATVSADVDTFDVNDLQNFQYEFSNIALKNPDIDGDNQQDFTLEVLGDNFVALAKDVLRGDRTVFGADLSAALHSVVGPLVDNPIGEWLGVQDALNDFLDNDDVPPVAKANSSIFEIDTADGFFDLFQGILQNGMPETPIDLARLKLNLDQIPLSVVDENLNFNLQTVLPDTLDVTGRAGIEQAFLAGQLVFGVDTSLNPLYLLTKPDSMTPDLATTLTGGFDVFVNVSGEPLADGGLTLQNADARVSPTISIDFQDLGLGKLRIGSDLPALGNIDISLEDEELLKLSADGILLTPGPFVASASDDDEGDQLPAVQGTINIDTGQIDLRARKFTAGLADVLIVEALPLPRVDGQGNPVNDPDTGQQIIDPGVSITFDPAADPSDPLLVTPRLCASLDALTVGEPPNKLTPYLEIVDGLAVTHSGQAVLLPPPDGQGVPTAELVIPPGYNTSAGIAGFLPVALHRLQVGFPDPTNLNVMTVCTTGQFLVDEVASNIESVFGTPVHPIFNIGNETTSCDGDPPAPGEFDFLLNVPSLVDGIVEPVNLGPITLGLEGLQVAGTVIDGQITLGGYQNGQWNSLLDGFFIFQTDPVDPTDDDFANITIQIDPTRSSLSWDGDSASLQLVANAQLDAGLSGPFGNIAAGGHLGFNVSLEATHTDAFPFFEITDFDASLGEISIENIEILLDDVLHLSATDITLNPAPGAGQPIGTIGSLSVDVLAFEDMPGINLQQTAVQINDVQLYQDRLLLNDVSFHLSGSIGSEDSTFFEFTDARLDFRAVEVQFSTGNPFVPPAGESAFRLENVSTHDIEFRLASAVLLPDQNGGLASISDMSGRFDSSKTLTITVGELAANLAGALQLEADHSVLVVGPNLPEFEPLLQVGTATVTVPLLESAVQMTAADLRISQSGQVTIAQALACVAAGPGDPSDADGCDLQAGFGATFGLGDFLPFDLTKVTLANADTSPVRLDDLDGQTIAIGVDGYFDFRIFDPFPVRPVIELSDVGTQSESDRSAHNPFHLVFLLDQQGVRLQETGFITLGFEDLTIGPLTTDARVTLGRFVNGEFEVGHLDPQGSVADGVEALVDVVWDQGDDVPVGFAAGARIVGALRQQLSPNDPSRWATTLDLNGTFQGSLSLAGGGDDSSWSFDLENLLVDFGIQLSVNQDLEFVPNPPAAGSGDPAPVLTFEGLQVESVVVGLGELLTMTAENAAVDFSALSEADANRPFLTFGGTRPVRPLPTEEDPFPSIDPQQIDGSISVTFGAPLEGLGGRAGNFGVGYNPNATIPLEFHQLNGFFVAMQVPPDFKFGLPDWLPLSVTELGVRFPENTLGDSLPFGSGEDTPPAVGDLETIARASLDQLSNFDLLFSGGLVSSEGGWPLQGQVEDVSVDVGKLTACVDRLASALDVNGNPYPATLAGLQRAIGEQGLALFSSLAGCEFPIENLDAVDVGIEPFELGPIEIGGGLGFGTVDAQIDTNGDGTPDKTEEVLFGRVEGQLAYSDIGVGVELIVTQYGPVLARLFAGVPIPIGTLVGALVGSVVPGLGTAAGASLGTQSGFIITGFQGGLVFDGQPLPVVRQPIDLLADPQIRFPLDISLEDIAKAAGTAIKNETFTWGNGFKFAASGTLTNTHVYGMIGASVTLGANVGFTAQQILDVDDNVPVTEDDFAYVDEQAVTQGCARLHPPCCPKSRWVFSSTASVHWKSSGNRWSTSA